MTTTALRRHRLLAALLLAWGGTPAFAQTPATPPQVPPHVHAADADEADGPDDSDATDGEAMDHEAMDHEAMDHEAMDHEGMDHEDMAHEGADDGAMDHEGMDHGTMDHGAMDMGHDDASAPPDGTRDPHAYAGGHTLTSGPYLPSGMHPMHTADAHPFATVLVNRLERVATRDDHFTTWDAQASLGWDFDKLVIQSEGDWAKGQIEHARNEVRWSHAVANFWDAQIGWRHDTGEAPDQDWLAVGLQGLAPYWFEVSASAYLGQGGQTALRLEGEHELLLTQRLILQPRAEFTAYGRNDARRGVGAGPAELTAGLRLRYEFSRQFAPYAGVEWQRLFGQTADLAREEGLRTLSARWTLGVRFWF